MPRNDLATPAVRRRQSTVRENCQLTLHPPQLWTTVVNPLPTRTKT